MKRESINYLAVGSFVLLALVLLLIVLHKITGRAGENDAYHIFYYNVSGLSVGTPVTYQGYKLGYVEAILPSQDGGKTRYRVDVRIRDDWRIPSDSVARIYAEGLLAETVINIEEGQAKEYLSIDGEIHGAQGVDVFAALGSIADDIGGLTSTSIKPLLDNLNSLVGTVGGEIEMRLPSILSDLNSLTSKLDASASHLSGMLNEQTTQKVSMVVDNVDSTSMNLLRMSESLARTQAEIDQLLIGANQLFSENEQDMTRSIVALRRSLEEVAKYTDSILFNLEGASRNMNEFSRQIRQNPGLLLGGKAPQDRGKARE